MSNLKKFFVALGGIAILLLLIIWQSGFFAGEKITPGKIAGGDKTVSSHDQVVMIKEHVLPVTYKAVGTVRSRDAVDLAARIIARVVEVKVREGDKVNQGDVLIKLEDAEYLAATAQVKAQVKAAVSSLNAATENIKHNQAALNFSKAENERIIKLFKSKIVSQKQVELAGSNYNQALAAWNQAIQAQGAASARLAAAKQSLLKIETVLAYATIKSPMNGIISERMVDPGDLANPGKILLKIFDPERLQLEVPVREGFVKKIKIGDNVPFNVGSLQKDFIGKVNEIIPAVDPGSRTFMVKITMNSNRQLVPGMFGTIHLPLGSRKVALIPKKAITVIGQVETVNVLIDGKCRRQFIRTTACSDKKMRRIVAGLNAGQQIVIKVK